MGIPAAHMIAAPAVENGCRSPFHHPGFNQLSSRSNAGARITMGVSIMTQDDRDIIETLKAELNFVEKGGYGRSVKTPWQPASIFQDSPSCLNLGDPAKTHPCSECLLVDFVPREARAETVPCHHIPLNASGDTIDEMEWEEDQPAMEKAVKNWLLGTIDKLEAERTT